MKSSFILIPLFATLFSFSAASQGGVKRTYKPLTEADYNVADLILAPEIWFQVDACELLPESRDSVAVIGEFIKKHPGYVVEVGVHSVVSGNYEENLKLSKCRAKAIVQVLVKELHFPKNALQARGYGSDEAIFDEEAVRTSREREHLESKNKRVEIKILVVK